MASPDKKELTRTYMLPEGRVINHALFERDAFTPEKGATGKPKYKVELAFDPKQVEGEGTIEDDMADFIAKQFGESVADEWLDKLPTRIRPMIDGNRLAADREAKGKEGDAYKGKLVIRSDTTFNKDGEEGPGGATVYGPDTSPLTVMSDDKIYPGCYGIAAVTFSAYKDYPRTGDRGIKCYLAAFQKTRDGDKLVTAADRSTLFKPVAGTANDPTAAPAARRRRVG